MIKVEAEGQWRKRQYAPNYQFWGLYSMKCLASVIFAYTDWQMISSCSEYSQILLLLMYFLR